MQDSTGNILEIQRFCIHDGQGIRTVVFLRAARSAVPGALIRNLKVMDRNFFILTTAA
jgi:hypothetical protein